MISPLQDIPLSRVFLVEIIFADGERKAFNFIATKKEVDDTGFHNFPLVEERIEKQFAPKRIWRLRLWNANLVDQGQFSTLEFTRKVLHTQLHPEIAPGEEIKTFFTKVL